MLSFWQKISNFMFLKLFCIFCNYYSFPIHDPSPNPFKKQLKVAYQYNIKYTQCGMPKKSSRKCTFLTFL